MKITENVYVENGFRGANVGYVTTESGLVMVDTPYLPTDAFRWKKEMEDKGTIKYLVNLEHHHDHCSGNFMFTDATAIAHEMTRQAMVTIDLDEAIENMAKLDSSGVSLIDKSKFNMPSITFFEHLTLFLGRHSFHLMYLPGHTSGQIAVFVPEEKVVFTGDNVTHKLRSILIDADALSWLESLDKIGELEVDYIVPGHGEVCDKSYLKEESKYIQDCLDAVKQAINNGWTKDEAIARVSWPNYLPLDEGLDDFESLITQGSIARLYDMLSN
jgi:glyoxylase-like metal-dependent hydrolase (beta-lactamase superfamily II)